MLAIMGYFYYKFDATQSLQDKTDKEEIVKVKTFPDDLRIGKESFTDKPKWYKEVSVEYPIGDEVGVAEVAKFAHDEASELWCTNDEENLSEKDVKKKGMAEMYECSLEVRYSYTHSKNLLSHKLGEYGMYGGVHGIYSAETLTYDTDGNKIKLIDMAVNKDTYKKDIVAKLKNSFSNSNNKDYGENFASLLSDIATEESIDSIPFIATTDGLVFLFSEIQGLPSAIGEVEIKIPFSELKGVLSNEFLS